MKVFVALPHYSKIEAEMGLSTHGITREHDVLLQMRGSSLLADNFNALWALALNTRPYDVFAMQHDDIEPDHRWLDTAIAEMQSVGADVLSVISPIKDDRGYTSTGVMHPEGGVNRFTFKEIYEQLPETFSMENINCPGYFLAVNTGLWVCDFTKPWVEEISFRITSWIAKAEDGKFYNRCIPEDWDFSRQCHKLGLKVFATRKIGLNHYGRKAYSNRHIWGTHTTERGD